MNSNQKYLLGLGSFAILGMVSIIFFISYTSSTGAQVVKIPHYDEYLSHYKGQPFLTSKIQVSDRGLSLANLVSRECLMNPNQNMRKCCRDTCPGVCGSMDKLCIDHCTASCSSITSQAVYAR